MKAKSNKKREQEIKKIEDALMEKLEDIEMNHPALHEYLLENPINLSESHGMKINEKNLKQYFNIIMSELQIRIEKFNSMNRFENNKLL